MRASCPESDESEIRISRRQKVVPTDSGEPRYKVTIKFGNGLSREEHEEQYNHLKASLPFAPITYLVEHGTEVTGNPKIIGGDSTAI